MGLDFQGASHTQTVQHTDLGSLHTVLRQLFEDLMVLFKFQTLIYSQKFHHKGNLIFSPEMHFERAFCSSTPGRKKILICILFLFVMFLLILPDFHSSVLLVPEHDLVGANLGNYWHAWTWQQQYGREVFQSCLGRAPSQSQLSAVPARCPADAVSYMQNCFQARG